MFSSIRVKKGTIGGRGFWLVTWSNRDYVVNIHGQIVPCQVFRRARLVA